MVPTPSRHWFKMPDHNILMGNHYAASLTDVLPVVDPFQKHWHAIPCSEMQRFLTAAGFPQA